MKDTYTLQEVLKIASWLLFKEDYDTLTPFGKSVVQKSVKNNLIKISETIAA